MCFNYPNIKHSSPLCMLSCLSNIRHKNINTTLSWASVASLKTVWLRSHSLLPYDHLFSNPPHLKITNPCLSKKSHAFLREVEDQGVRAFPRKPTIPDDLTTSPLSKKEKDGLSAFNMLSAKDHNLHNIC